ncbi:hypothetical protein GPECTOR_70g517 [Gonium pectorale]|uniref:AB hydrolase-1 domain-containing protein n=1 Tax=Gonium pectorale TaxID=33097 RepID=A0A150G335_GONPE|nr:hypothetical protein GPECTOR_70g517 [Gonium pectorale]|eukprot:KXZ44286.1 hypothetical protein GPECTOR_70g517 [Gonium pectorale]
MTVREHIITVPLDYSERPTRFSGQTIKLFAYELSPHTRKEHLPWLLYLQGGPGFEAPRPYFVSAWNKPALDSHRVLLLDQRGTGGSAPVTTSNLAKRGGPEEQAEYLALFRQGGHGGADNIVRDCEVVRKLLVSPSSYGGRWALLGQSFGGFCVTSYLSMAPEGVLEAMLTGGLPPGVTMACSADAVYRALHARILRANEKYYKRYPDDVELVTRIVQYLAAQPGGGAPLPDGSVLTPRLFQTLGLNGLGSGGSFERLHFLLESFFDADEEMTPRFAKSFLSWLTWDTNPLYALLHEPIYCQPGGAANWAADRVRNSPPFADLFDAHKAVQENRPVMFTGECVYKFHYEDVACLRPFKETAELLARKSDWGPLYDADKLACNRVPTAAIAYLDDVFVDFNMSQETANRIQGLKLWATNEFRHSGIRDEGHRIFDRLLGLVRNAVFD